MSMREQLRAVDEAQATQPAAVPVRRGTMLPCPLCGAEEATVSLDLDDLDTCNCGECEGTFTLESVRDFIARWSKVLTWVELFPKG